MSKEKEGKKKGRKKVEVKYSKDGWPITTRDDGSLIRGVTKEQFFASKNKEPENVKLSKYFDYQSKVFAFKATEVLKVKSPKQKVKDKIEALQRQLAEMESEG